MHHCLSFLVDNMPAYFTHQNREGKKHVEESNMEVCWCYNLPSRQPLTELKRETQLLKPQSGIYRFYVPSHGKHCRDMTTAANRGQIEFISETTLNRLKATSSTFQNRTKTSFSMSRQRNQASNGRKRDLIEKEHFDQLLPDSLHPLLLIYLARNETRTKDVNSRTFIAVMKQNTDSHPRSNSQHSRIWMKTWHKPSILHYHKIDKLVS